MKPRRLIGALGALLTFGLVISLGLSHESSATTVSERVDLLNAIAVRAFEGRLDGLLLYAPHKPNLKNSELLAQRTAVLRRIKKRGYRDSSAQALADEGVLFLIVGRPEDAVEKLTKAVRLQPQNPSLRSDLAAVYLDLGKRNPSEYVASLTEADLAVKLDPYMQEARFNKALALEKLYLLEEARISWEKFLELDSNSEWAVEVRDRLQGIESRLKESPVLRYEEVRSVLANGDEKDVLRIVEQSPQLAREYAEEELLWSWAEAQGSQDVANAGEILRQVKSIGKKIEQSSGESTLTLSVQAIEERMAAGGDLQGFVDGHRLFSEGISLYREANYSKARRIFEGAHLLLSESGSEFSMWPLFYSGVCAYQELHYDESIRVMDSLITRLDARKFPVLRGRALWIKALIQNLEGDLASSLANFLGSLEEFQGTGELENLAAIHTRIGGVLGRLGDYEGAWSHHIAALEVGHFFRDPRRRQYMLEEIVDLLVKSDQGNVALYFQREIVRVAEESGDPILLASALRMLATLQAINGEVQPALGTLEEARGKALEVQEEAVRSVLLGDIILAEGMVHRDAAPAQAYQALTEALRSAGESHFYFQRAQIHLELARVLLKLGDLGSSESSYRLAFAERERHQSTVDPLRKIQFSKQSRKFFDEMIFLQIMHKKDPIRALEYAEQSRSLLHLEFAKGNDKDGAITPNESSMVPSIRRSLPLGSALVYFHIVEDQIYVWIINDEVIKLERVRKPVGAIRSYVLDLKDKLESRGSVQEISSLSGRLFDALLGSVIPHLSGVKKVAFVPDSFLFQIPFGALFDTRREKFLVEDFVVVVVPSASILMRSLAADVAHGHLKFRALTVQGLDTASDAFPNLSPLTMVEQELESVEAVFSSDRLPEGDKDLFLRAIGRYPVVHFAGHAISNSENPLMSMLLFRSEDIADEGGVLFAEELLDAGEFRETQLVVLSACSTAGSPALTADGDGIVGLAYPFLIKGVPSVVASLWHVDDAATAEFMGRFYSHLCCAGPVAALRQAQLETLRLNDAWRGNPGNWAGFQLYGGDLDSVN